MNTKLAAAIALAAIVALVPLMIGDASAEDAALTPEEIGTQIVVPEGEVYSLDGKALTFVEGGSIRIESGATLVLTGDFSLSTATALPIMTLAEGAIMEVLDSPMTITEEDTVILDGTLDYSLSFAYEEVVDGALVTSLKLSIDLDGTMTDSGETIVGGDGPEVYVDATVTIGETISAEGTLSVDIPSITAAYSGAVPDIPVEVPGDVEVTIPEYIEDSEIVTEDIVVDGDFTFSMAADGTPSLDLTASFSIGKYAMEYESDVDRVTMSAEGISMSMAIGMDAEGAITIGSASGDPGIVIKADSLSMEYAASGTEMSMEVSGFSLTTAAAVASDLADLDFAFEMSLGSAAIELKSDDISASLSIEGVSATADTTDTELGFHVSVGSVSMAASDPVYGGEAVFAMSDLTMDAKATVASDASDVSMEFALAIGSITIDSDVPDMDAELTITGLSIEGTMPGIPVDGTSAAPGLESAIITVESIDGRVDGDTLSVSGIRAEGAVTDSEFDGTLTIRSISAYESGRYAGWDVVPGGSAEGVTVTIVDTKRTVFTADRLTISSVERAVMSTETYTGFREVTDEYAVYTVTADTFRMDAVGYDGSEGYIEATDITILDGTPAAGSYVFALGAANVYATEYMAYIEDFTFPEGTSVEFRDSYVPDMTIMTADADGRAHLSYYCSDRGFTDLGGNSIVFDSESEAADLNLDIADGRITAATVSLCADPYVQDVFSGLLSYDGSSGGIPYELGSDGVGVLEGFDGTVCVDASQRTYSVVIGGESAEYEYGELIPMAPSQEVEGQVFIGWYDGYYFVSVGYDGTYDVQYSCTITDVWVPESYSYDLGSDGTAVVQAGSGFYQDSVADILSAVPAAERLTIVFDIGSVTVDIADISGLDEVTALMFYRSGAPASWMDYGDGTLISINVFEEIDSDTSYVPFTAEIEGSGTVQKINDLGMQAPVSFVEDDGILTITETDSELGSYMVTGSAAGQSGSGSGDMTMYIVIGVIVILIVVVAAVALSRRGKSA